LLLVCHGSIEDAGDAYDNDESFDDGIEMVMVKIGFSISILHESEASRLSSRTAAAISLRPFA